jgi:hypothetical protein
MSELKVLKTNALKAWRGANDKGKALLENLYGEEIFQNQDVRDRIKSFEDARIETGRPDVPDFSSLPDSLKKRFQALYKMDVIIEALNEGWEPNWGDTTERKWRPWFYMSPFRFYDSGFGLVRAYAGGGSRLYLKSKELSDYCADQFLDIWKDIQVV